MTAAADPKTSARALPLLRLKAVAIVWWVLAALPLLVGLTIEWFSASLALAIFLRLALGIFAWRKAQRLLRDPNERLGFSRFAFLLAPLLLFGAGVASERGRVAFEEPSVSMPEMRLTGRGTRDGRPWFGDRDNPWMAMCAGMLTALVIGISIALARAPRVHHDR